MNDDDDEDHHSSAARYRELFEQLFEPVSVLAPIFDGGGQLCEARVLAVNDAFERIMGLRREDVVGAEAGASWPTRPEVLAACARAMATGEPQRLESAHPDGRVFEIRVFRLDEGTFAIAGHELTEALRHARERERLLEEREELVRTISHDLRAPLTAICSQAQLLARDPAPERVGPKARTIAATARRASEMIRDLVETARADAGFPLRPVPLALRPFLEDLLARLDGGLAVERIRLDVPPDFPPLRADPARFERVMVNLLANGLRHGPAGTEVVVTARSLPGAVLLEIRDHGPGIAEKDLPRIFDRAFHRERGGADGLGLGLQIARRFVEAHGGTIEVASEPGEGATFRVRLPLAG